MAHAEIASVRPVAAAKSAEKSTADASKPDSKVATAQFTDRLKASRPEAKVAAPVLQAKSQQRSSAQPSSTVAGAQHQVRGDWPDWPWINRDGPSTSPGTVTQSPDLAGSVLDAAHAWTDYAVADASRSRTDPNDRQSVGQLGSQALAAASRYSDIHQSIQNSLTDMTMRSGAPDLRAYGTQLRSTLESNVMADPGRRSDLDSMVAALWAQTANRPTVESLVGGIVG